MTHPTFQHRHYVKIADRSEAPRVTILILAGIGLVLMLAAPIVARL